MLTKHSHDHSSHTHHHDVELNNINKTFIIGIVLNAGYVLVEAAAGIATNSLALLSDAGHNLGDVTGLLIALLAFKIGTFKPTKHYTYGFNKLTIIAGMVNAIILSIAVGSIGYSAINRFMNLIDVNGFEISLFAFIGIIINGFSAWLFFKQNQHDINIKGAYLHLLADALISTGVVIAGILIHFTGWNWLDPLVSILIMVVILISTWRLLKSTIRLTLDGVPEQIDMENILALKNIDDNIDNLHHIHVWPISSSQNALTAHVLIKNDISSTIVESIKEKLKKSLLNMHIHHVTLEMEFKNCHSDENEI